MASLHLISDILAIVGESFNTIGAFVLAKDVLGRKRERDIVKSAQAFLKKLRSTGSEVAVEDPEVAVLRDAVRLGRQGCAWIFVGFMLLVIHWGLDIYGIVARVPQQSLTP
jgi:hypothetical protein